MTVNKEPIKDNPLNPYMSVLRLVGDLWTLAIIADLEDSERRFGELQKAIRGINPVTLTNRLRRLEEAALVNRVTESQDKQSVIYSLSSRGRRLLPIISAIKKASSDLV